ncbi:MAG TPA: tetratricopeptide repeat protein, partial [Candidatus Hydrogenedentes bacterium]|nr:tetratricopeptide repeat protein [Candidatus Hydrogenedentota bacterium]
AAHTGDFSALHEVCLWLLHGWGGFPKVPELAAVKWFEMTFHGYTPAMRSMGECCFTGAGVPQNRAMGLAFFMSAAERGDREAARFLGRSLLFGEGTEQDHEQAVKWLRTAAQQDDPESLYLLGLAHVKGWGVARDTAWGKELIQTAAAKGCAEAVQTLKDLRKKPPAN